MKKLLLSFPGSYSRTLRKHLAAGAPSDLSGARRLGRNARSINLTANELAEIHKKAMKEITSPQGTAEKRARARRAFSFLSQVTASAAQGEATVAPPSNSVLRTALAEMTRRATGLAAANDALKNEIARRETARLILQKDNDAAHEELFRSRHLAEEMRHLSHRLLTAQEDERRSISRELHDVVVQALTSIHLRLTVLKTQSSLSPEISKRISVTEELLEKSVAIVHQFARDLRPSVLDDLGLIPALRSHLKTFSENTSIATTFNAYRGVENQSVARRTVLFRIAQESLTNIARHSAATAVELTIEAQTGSVLMTVRDNGKGFAVDQAVSARGNKGLGLLGMKERVEMVGGWFRVDSAPGTPTTITVEFPLIPLPKSQPRRRLRRNGVAVAKGGALQEA